MGDDGARRCDNCGVIRESFMCAPCLRQAVSDHASRVRAARARTRSAAAQCYPVLQARQALVVHDRGLQHLRSLMRQQVLAIQKLQEINRRRAQDLRERLDQLSLACRSLMNAAPSEARDESAQSTHVDRCLEAIYLQRRRIVKCLLERLYTIKRVTFNTCSIVACLLPDDCFDLHATIHSGDPESAQGTVAALGYIVFVTIVTAWLYNVHLPHPLTYFGSESSVTCRLYGAPQKYALSLESPGPEFQTALELLDQDIRYVCQCAGLPLSLLPALSLLPNLLMFLEAVQLPLTRIPFAFHQSQTELDSVSMGDLNDADSGSDFVLVD
ncbi:unnamed protein product (mitochondrion) [Plasmodiophora brassicae]|uniref:Uncharacterized protein n=2 Tax=Plasmodiophora brassicae TaxID=37360 RepID=A0A3P3YIW0_PLABS|nr:unnamed protein product [Plasmodiophora brassicae]